VQGNDGILVRIPVAQAADAFEQAFVDQLHLGVALFKLIEIEAVHASFFIFEILAQQEQRGASRCGLFHG